MTGWRHDLSPSLRTAWLLILSDLYRYEGRADLKACLKHLAITPGFKYTFWMRLCWFLRTRKLLKYTIYIFSKAILLRLRHKYGIAIPEYTKIGPGFFINRFGGVYFHGDTVIGANVNITHGTVLGMMNRGPRQGCPIIGDRVFFGARSMAQGSVTIGDDAAVGACALVTKDVPPHGVAGGVPAKVLSSEGSDGYINRQVDLAAFYAKLGRTWPPAQAEARQPALTGAEGGAAGHG